MKTAKAHSAHLIGLEAHKVTVEVDISNGLHAFSVIGLGDRSVEEAKDRIGAAIKNTGYISPKQKNQKVVISLAPADIRKEGAGFDLAMAMAYLAGAGDIEFEHEHMLFLGELSLEGDVRPIRGILPILIKAPSLGITTAFIPEGNDREAALATGIIVYAVKSLKETIAHIMRTAKIEPLRLIDYATGIDEPNESEKEDLRHIRGNETAKRALEIAVAGCHNAMLYGPPGTGKTMLARSASSIMPSLSREHAIEVTSIHSIAHSLESGLLHRPPFRSPHHTASMPAIFGGGQQIKPGEITLAHRGILFMDEFPEFDRDILEALRQPLEDKTVTVARSRGSVAFPAQCMLIGSMNPCRCGKSAGNCSCTAKNIETYRKKLSGPILDRIDIWIEVASVDHDKLSAKDIDSESSRIVRKRVERVRKIQYDRFPRETGRAHIFFNSEMSASDIALFAKLDDDARDALKAASKSIGLSGRSFHSAIKVARTIADLDDSASIQKKHLLEALQYRKRSF